jgi:raffinose/stachyose/melibiose transport system substrate-binding protein
MMNGRTWRRPWRPAALVGAALLLSACSAGSLGSSGGGAGGQTLDLLIGNDESTVALADALVKDFNAANQGVTVTVETRPGGSEGDNVIKTRLATGDMPDVFQYNAGSLLQALNPQQQLTPVTGQSWVGSLQDDFRSAVTAGGDVFGAPFGASFGGGVLYSKPVYQRLGLTVPTTWAEFMANNAKIKAAGVDPVVQTYGDTWTSQLLVLADFHNVAAAQPSFAEQYTAGQLKYATSPAAIRGFEHLQEVHDAGYLNADFASAKLEDGLREVATGKGAHYPGLTVSVIQMVQNNPSAAQDVGFFALPGDDAATNGATQWLATGLYIPKTTTGAKLDAAEKFLAWVASPAGCQTARTAVPPPGPFQVQGCDLPADVPAAVGDVARYIDRGAASPALEFLSPVKGPSLEQITVEVGSGIRSAQDGAALYDEDVRKQAQQLGLPGWD